MSRNIEKIDRRILRTKESIEDAFLKVLQQKTLQELSIQDITIAANINRSTFYAHFTDKFDLFNHIIRKTFRQTLSSYIPEGTPYAIALIPKLVQATFDYFVFLNSQCPPEERLLRPVAESQIQSVLLEVLMSWISKKPSTNPDPTILFVSWGIFGTMLDAVANEMSNDREHAKERVAEISVMLMRNLDKKQKQ